jgi:MFS family permease
LLLLIKLLNGALSAAATLPTEALIVDSSPVQSRGEILGFTSACAMAGRWTGPVFGGTIQWASNTLGLSLDNSYRIPYFVDSLLAALTLYLVYWKVVDFKPSKIKAKEKSSKNEVKFTSSMKVIMFLGFTYGGALGLTMPLSALLYNDKFGVKPLIIGTIISLTGLVGLFSSWAAGKLSDKAGRKPVLAIGEGLGRLMGLLLPLMPTVNLTALCHFFRKTGFSIGRPAMDAIKADVAPVNQRGEYFGYYQIAFRVGDITFPTIGTYLYATYLHSQYQIGRLVLPGYSLPYILSSTLGLIGLVSVILLVNTRGEEIHLIKE